MLEKQDRDFIEDACGGNALRPPRIDRKLFLTFHFDRKTVRPDQILTANSGLVLIALDDRFRRVRDSELFVDAINDAVHVVGDVPFCSSAFIADVYHQRTCA